jgi:hypothetical protein
MAQRGFHVSDEIEDDDRIEDDVDEADEEEEDDEEFDDPDVDADFQNLMQLRAEVNRDEPK